MGESWIFWKRSRGSEEGQDPVAVAQPGPHQLGVGELPHGLEDDLRRGQLEGGVRQRRLVQLLLLEGVVAGGVSQDRLQHGTRMLGQQVLELRGLDRAQLQQGLAQPHAVAGHQLGGAIEVELREAAGPHQAFAQVLGRDARGGPHDAALPEAHATLDPARLLQVQQAGSPAHVEVPQQCRQHAGSQRPFEHTSPPPPALGERPLSGAAWGGPSGPAG